MLNCNDPLYNCVDRLYEEMPKRLKDLINAFRVLLQQDRACELQMALGFVVCAFRAHRPVKSHAWFTLIESAATALSKTRVLGSNSATSPRQMTNITHR